MQLSIWQQVFIGMPFVILPTKYCFNFKPGFQKVQHRLLAKRYKPFLHNPKFSRCLYLQLFCGNKEFIAWLNCASPDHF